MSSSPPRMDPRLAERLAEAFDHLISLLDRHVPIDEDVILTLHRIVMDKNLASAGAFRR